MSGDAILPDDTCCSAQIYPYSSCVLGQGYRSRDIGTCVFSRISVLLVSKWPVTDHNIITSVCCQGIETQGQGVQLQGQGLGPALIQTCYGTEQEVMSLVVYCRCHVTDKQLSASKDLRDSYGLLAVTRMSSSTKQANISLT